MTRVINYAKLRSPQPAMDLYPVGGAGLSPAPHASPTVTPRRSGEYLLVGFPSGRHLPGPPARLYRV